MAKAITLTGIGRAAGGKFSSPGTMAVGAVIVVAAGGVGYYLWKKYKGATRQGLAGIGAQPPLYIGDHAERIKNQWWARQRELEFQRAYPG